MGRERWTNRLTVEDCLCLDVAAMQRDGVFAGPVGDRWKTMWINAYGSADSILNYSVIQNAFFGLMLRLDSEVIIQNSSVRLAGEQLVRTTTTRPHLGGVRFWFRCVCGRRVGKFYLPPAGHFFRCRHCYNLTYQSAQTHDKRRDALMRDPAALRAALRSKNHRTYRLGADAVRQTDGTPAAEARLVAE